MLTKDQVLKALAGSEIVAKAIGVSPTEVLRKALQSEQESPEPTRPGLMLMRKTA